MTMTETWLRIKTSLGLSETAQSLITNERAERIQRQIADIESIAIEHARAIGKSLSVRCAVLEGRAENVDAFYVKTVTQALSERQDRIGKSFQAQINQNNIDIGAAKAEVYERMDKLTLEMVGRIDAITAQLREERSRIDGLVTRHATLLSKLRAGLE